MPIFPRWLQLHEWLPAVFAAEGDCLEDSWQFLSMGMAEWMQIIFAAYFAVFAIVFACRLLDKKPLFDRLIHHLPSRLPPIHTEQGPISFSALQRNTAMQIAL